MLAEERIDWSFHIVLLVSFIPFDTVNPLLGVHPTIRKEISLILISNSPSHLLIS